MHTQARSFSKPARVRALRCTLSIVPHAEHAVLYCAGTPEFMAPELYEEEYDDRVDVYSFGM